MKEMTTYSGYRKSWEKETLSILGLTIKIS